VYFVLFVAVLFTVRDGVLGQVYFKRDVVFSADVWQSLL
jgi:hypothetical protein